MYVRTLLLLQTDQSLWPKRYYMDHIITSNQATSTSRHMPLTITSELHLLCWYQGYPRMVATCYLLVSKFPEVSSIFTVLGISQDGSDWQPSHPPPWFRLVIINLIPLLIRSQWKTLASVCSLWNSIFVLQIEPVSAVQLHTLLNMFVWMCNEIGGLYDKTNITIVLIPKKKNHFLS